MTYALFFVLGFCQLTVLSVWSAVEQNKNGTEVQNASEPDDRKYLRVSKKVVCVILSDLAYLAVAIPYGICLSRKIRKIGASNDFDTLEVILIRRWKPWFAYSVTVSILIAMSVKTAPLDHSGIAYILLLASITINYWIIANLPTGTFVCKKLPGSGLSSAAEVLDDLLDSTQLLLLLIDEKRQFIPVSIQLAIILFSCANFVSPTLLLGDLAPAWARRWLSQRDSQFCPEFYTVVDKLFVDVPRAAIRIILIVCYKEAADEDVLELFVCKTALTILVPLFVVVRDKLSSKIDALFKEYDEELAETGNTSHNANGAGTDDDDDGVEVHHIVHAMLELDKETTMDLRHRPVRQTDTND